MGVVKVLRAHDHDWSHTMHMQVSHVPDPTDAQGKGSSTLRAISCFNMSREFESPICVQVLHNKKHFTFLVWGSSGPRSFSMRRVSSDHDCCTWQLHWRTQLQLWQTCELCAISWVLACRTNAITVTASANVAYACIALNSAIRNSYITGVRDVWNLLHRSVKRPEGWMQ